MRKKRLLGVVSVVGVGALFMALPESTDAGALAPCPYDCAGLSDGHVGVQDFLALLGQWGEIGTACDADADGVDVVDFLNLLSNWGPCQ